MENKQEIITKVEKPNSFEFGKAGNRHKIYYDTPENLLAHLNKLKELQLFEFSGLQDLK